MHQPRAASAHPSPSPSPPLSVSALEAGPPSEDIPATPLHPAAPVAPALPARPALPALPSLPTPNSLDDPSSANARTSSTPSPPSTDADVPGPKPHNPRKRPLENPEKPPPKRDNKPKRITWFDTIREAWARLVKVHPGRNEFTPAEIIKTVDNEWTSIRKDRKGGRWKKDLQKAIRKEGMLAKILDKPGDLYTMHNPNYVPQKPQRKRDQPEEDPKPLEDVYRATVPTEWTAEAFKPLRLSTFDKASAIQFVGDRNLNTVKGHKGYRMVRATSGVCEGDWYFEAKLLQHPGEGAVRLGWCQRRSDVETPVGFDAYGFGIRDRTGEFIHSARLKPYGLSFAVDDVIGCRITLPQLNDDQKAKIAEADQKWLEHRFIAFLQGQTPPDSGIDIILESCVQFYKNGVCMGVPSFFTDAKETAAAAAAERQREGRQARKGKVDGKAKDNSKAIGKPASTPPKREMKAGVYFPALALFGNAVVKANFGPEFEFPLPEGSQPMCQAARDAPPIDLTVSADPDVDMTKGSGAIEATQDNKTSEARAIQSVAASGSGTGNSASKNEKSNGIGMQVPETIDLDSSSDVIEVAASTLQNDAGQQKQETEAGRAKTE